jgi:hypothetical protein
MRAIVFAMLLSSSACAAARAGTGSLFGPDVDDDAAGTSDDPALFGSVFQIEGHRLSPHPGCVASARPHGGIVRCPEAGHLSWTYVGDHAAAIDELDLLEKRMTSFAGQLKATLRRADFDCELAATPGLCRAYVFTNAAGSGSEIFGLAEGASGSLLVECASRPGKVAAMKPVCSDVFQPR